MKSSYFIVLAIAIIALISVEFIIETTEIGNLHAELEASQRHSAATADSLRGMAPGLGEYMMAIQQHHAKLWFAGVNGNWGLASYELGELDELFADVIQYYPMHDSIMLAPVVHSLRAFQLATLDSAVARRGEGDSFKTAFIALNAACNNCHKATGHPFLRIQPPTAPSATNQEYGPATP